MFPVSFGTMITVQLPLKQYRKRSSLGVLQIYQIAVSFCTLNFVCACHLKWNHLPLAQIFAFSFLAPVEQSNEKDHKIDDELHENAAKKNKELVVMNAVNIQL